MDAQGRGRADNIDPADQWVLNPNTGEYELRLPASAPQSPVPGPRRPAPQDTGGAARTRGDAAASRTPQARETRRTRGTDVVPPSRRRRSTEPEPPPGRRGRRPVKKKSKVKKILAWTAGGTAFVLVAIGTAGYLYLKHLEGNVTTTDIGSAGKSGFSKDEAFNILIIGTDKRTGKGNGGYGDRNSVGHADTTILLHVSKDRTNATALSIPRDLIVNVPDCPTKQPDGSEKVIPGTDNTRFNVSLGQEGRDPGCTMRTVDEVTGITVDHFMMVDFNAVKTLTTAVGGVDVCLKHAVDDKDSHLKLSAGKHKVQGEQALAFVRTRHSWGNQGDLDRIKVQQQFMASLMRKMSSSDTLTSPTKLINLAEAATKALTVDKGIGSVSTLKDIALELKKVPPKNISFMTVPVLDNPADGTVHKTVIINPNTAPAVFNAINNDVSFTEVKKKKKAAKDAAAARLKGSRSAPSEVRVRVLNGGAPAGSAQETLQWLQNKEGVLKSENAGNAPKALSKTTLEYAPDQASQARELAALMGLPGTALKPGKSVTNSQGLPAMTLTLGKDFKGAGVSLTAPKKAPSVDKSTADTVQCAS
ncbi:LytR family transcriptional regulator [Streptomyces pluripotens]|uniref:LytR family transcriptional regulator n=1 Tax=Streptomyces pluripotens TaxID=1355015 RepID=A0A221NYB0_9ACTN|nr:MULTISPECIES: LCP family protein [Streptomyces]ARP70546.1 LytR family transcriptional regulator [Streptomyces pluripotens]ASN24806.1 LytR family transcriptional regulator [Streptomyces pluripotens]KIE27620.1 LytR family transcriptional regulator [Streptomyces sp. MUSC 125]MCH0556768.1 LCP family protein [Streptomyces sp. MUM 16J]